MKTVMLAETTDLILLHASGLAIYLEYSVNTVKVDRMLWNHIKRKNTSA